MKRCVKRVQSNFSTRILSLPFWPSWSSWRRQRVGSVLVLLTPASTVSGLAMELTQGRRKLIDTQASLGVRAGCQLWERFVSMVGGGEVGACSGTLIPGLSSVQAHAHQPGPFVLLRDCPAVPREDCKAGD